MQNNVRISNKKRKNNFKYLFFLLFLIIIGYFTYHYRASIILIFSNNESIHLDFNDIQEMLNGFIQTLAGIFAIAISFSVLFVQVSVDSYSLRASKILLDHHPFKKLIRSNIIGLVLLLILLHPIFNTNEILRYISAIFGITIFLSLIILMVWYIRKTVIFLTPESIILSLLPKRSPYEIYMEALEFNREGIQKPVLVSMSSKATVRILFDFIRQMIHQSDHIAVVYSVKTLMGYSGIFFNYSNPESFLSNSFFTLLPISETYRQQMNISEEEVSKIEEAIIIYFFSSLCDIWDIAISENDKITGAIVLNCFEDLVRPQIPSYQIFTEAAYSVGRKIFPNNGFLKDTGNNNWRRLRTQYLNQFARPIQYLFDRQNSTMLETIKFDFDFSQYIFISDIENIMGKEYIEVSNLSVLFFSFIEIDEFLLTEEKPDFDSERMVIRTIDNLTRLSIFNFRKKNEDFILIEAADFFARRFSKAKNTLWQDSIISDFKVLRLLRDSTINWIGGEAAQKYSGKMLSNLEWAYNSVYNILVQYDSHSPKIKQVAEDYITSFSFIAKTALDNDHSTAFDMFIGNFLPAFSKISEKGRIFGYIKELLHDCNNKTNPHFLNVCLSSTLHFLLINKDYQNESEFISFNKFINSIDLSKHTTDDPMLVNILNKIKVNISDRLNPANQKE